MHGVVESSSPRPSCTRNYTERSTISSCVRARYFRLRICGHTLPRFLGDFLVRRLWGRGRVGKRERVCDRLWGMDGGAGFTIDTFAFDCEPNTASSSCAHTYYNHLLSNPPPPPSHRASPPHPPFVSIPTYLISPHVPPNLLSLVSPRPSPLTPAVIRKTCNPAARPRQTSLARMAHIFSGSD